VYISYFNQPYACDDIDPFYSSGTRYDCLTYGDSVLPYHFVVHYLKALLLIVFVTGFLSEATQSSTRLWTPPFWLCPEHNIFGKILVFLQQGGLGKK